LRHPRLVSARFRCVVLTASIGAGHDLPAEILRGELMERCPAGEVEVLDCLELAGGFVERAISSASYESDFANRLFDVEHRLLHDVKVTRRAAGRLGELLAGPSVLRALAERQTTVVVSTYPGSTEVLGRLRGSGRLRIPVVAAITDLAALRFWSHPGADLHLVTQAESIPEVRAIAGPRTEVVHVRGFDDSRFADLPSRAAARGTLDLPADGPVIVVSGGGWAVGDLGGAAEESLGVPGAFVVVLCGSRDDVRSALASRFASSPRVRVLGFTDRMPDVLAAADVLIHSTAGLTVMEALVAGCSVISYGWGRGHIRANNAAFAEHGMAQVASHRSELRTALTTALATRRAPDPAFRDLPTAAQVVLERFGAQSAAA
jgi:processive 1,2-diacylglycerol beta-glucosyltransferase